MTTKYQIEAPIHKKIAVIADLHGRGSLELLERIKGMSPDIIAMPGDIVEPTSHNHSINETCEFLRKTTSIAPVVMSLGNHESRLNQCDIINIKKSGVILLDNDYLDVEGILFAGLSNAKIHGGIDKKFLDDYASKEGYKVLLCHNPEYYDCIEHYEILLVISGHAHGGQIRIAGRGVFAPNQGFLPKYYHGVYGKMIVSAGITNTVPVPRWCNPCEIVCIELGENINKD